MKIITKFLISSVLVLFVFWSCSKAIGQETSLTILLTGSMHGQLDPCGWKKNPMGGLPRRYTKIKELRDEGVDPLLVDAGDFFFSTTKIDLANKQSEKFRAESILEGFKTYLPSI